MKTANLISARLPGQPARAALGLAFIILLLVVMFLPLGCSRYSVSHGETYGADGTIVGMTDTIEKMVPLGGKDITAGSLAIDNTAANKWSVKLGESGNTDLTGTAALVESLVSQLTQISGQLAQQQMLNQALQQQMQARGAVK